MSSGLTLPAESLFPEGSSVYEWCYDQKERTWVQWMDTVPEFKCDPDRPFSQVCEREHKNAREKPWICPACLS